MNDSKELSNIAASLFRAKGEVDGEYILRWLRRASKPPPLLFHEWLSIQSILLRMRGTSLPPEALEFTERCGRSEFAEVRINTSILCDRALGEAPSKVVADAYFKVLHMLAGDEDSSVRNNAEIVLNKYKM